MNRRADNIRRQIAKRRRLHGSKGQSVNRPYTSHDEGDTKTIKIDSNNSLHPLWNREVFLLKIFCSSILVLLMAIVFQSTSPKLEKAKGIIRNTMEKEFQFAAVGEWYEDKFGEPLALFPPLLKEEEGPHQEQIDYALPVSSGKILEHFSGDSRGIILETAIGSEVESMSSGVVVFAGTKEDIGQTVIIQHPDRSKSWYGKLDQIIVKPFEKVEAGKIIGVVSSGKEKLNGEFYFAIEKDDAFIDPIQVMKFE